jgi:hypothetical protein
MGTAAGGTMLGAETAVCGEDMIHLHEKGPGS